MWNMEPACLLKMVMGGKTFLGIIWMMKGLFEKQAGKSHILSYGLP